MDIFTSIWTARKSFPENKNRSAGHRKTKCHIDFQMFHFKHKNTIQYQCKLSETSNMFTNVKPIQNLAK